MSKEKALNELQKVIEEHRGSKQGNIAYEDVRHHAKSLLETDREGVVEALRHWISLREVHRTEYAISLAEDLTLKELKPDIEEVREDIIARRYYPAPDTYWTDRALKALDDES